MFGVFYFAFPYFADILVEVVVPPVVIGDEGGIHMGIGQKRTFATDTVIGGGGW